MKILKVIDTWLSDYGFYRKQRGALLTPVLLNSIPKSGTHLLSNMLFAIPHTRMKADMTDADKISDAEARFEYVSRLATPQNAGSLYIGHIPYSERIADFLNERGIKQVFVYRDPRDVSVSMYHYVMREGGSHYHKPLFSKMKDDADRLLTVIEGHGLGQTQYEVSAESVPSLWHYYQAYMPWLSAPNTLSLSFEDLTSPDLKASSIQRLLTFLEVPHSEESVNKIIRLGQNPKKSSTFRKGKSGSWREEYQDSHHQAFERVGGKQILEQLGYKV